MQVTTYSDVRTARTRERAHGCGAAVGSIHDGCHGCEYFWTGAGSPVIPLVGIDESWAEASGWLHRAEPQRATCDSDQ